MLACASAPMQTVSRWLVNNGLLKEVSLTSTGGGGPGILRFRLPDRWLPDRTCVLARNASINFGFST